MESAGINMLRLVAVENQKNGRREFTSLHVANSLVRGGRDLELPLWLRLDCEDAVSKALPSNPRNLDWPVLSIPTYGWSGADDAVCRDHTAQGVTLIKTLESLTDSAPALYQFKHLSFQARGNQPPVL